MIGLITSQNATAPKHVIEIVPTFARLITSQNATAPKRVSPDAAVASV